MRKEELDWKLYIVIENINLDVMHIRWWGVVYSVYATLLSYGFLLFIIT
jgi:hypothetical protein